MENSNVKENLEVLFEKFKNMKSFDFDAPHQVWVNYVKQRMEEAKQKKVENKKGFWASLFGR